MSLFFLSKVVFGFKQGFKTKQTLSCFTSVEHLECHNGGHFLLRVGGRERPSPRAVVDPPSTPPPAWD